MEADTELRSGYNWLLVEAVRIGGDLGRILELEPPESAGEDWHRGFYLCRVDLIDLLYPDGAGCSLAAYLAEHRVDAADAIAVRRFADPACELTISETRTRG